MNRILKKQQSVVQMEDHSAWLKTKIEKGIFKNTHFYLASIWNKNKCESRKERKYT